MGEPVLDFLRDFHNPGSLFNDPLTTSGSPVAAFQMTDDFSSVEQEFRIIPADNEYIRIDEISLNIVSAGALNPNGYMNLAALANGMEAIVKTGGGVRFYLNGKQEKIKRLSDWSRILDLTVHINDAGGSWVSGYRKFPEPIWLNPGTIHKLGFLAKDNFSTLTRHEIFVRGRRFSKDGLFIEFPRA